MLGLPKIDVPPTDFKGQKLAEEIYQYTIAAFAIIGFVIGFVTEQFTHSVYIFAFGIVLSAVLVLPPWPFYRRHSIRWLQAEGKKSSPSSSSEPAQDDLSAAKKKK
eukprot:Opistho-2@95321